MLNVMAIDIGASNGRVIIGSFDGSKLYFNEAGRFPNIPVRVMGGLYWNVLSLYEDIKNVICKCKKQGIELSSIAFDTWAQDFGLIGNGTLISNPHHYRDPYTDCQIEKAESRMSQQELFNITGTHAFQGSTLYQLLAIKEKYPCLINCSDYLLFMPNLFTYLISGIASCDCTIASISQVYDIFQNKWSEKIIETYELPGIFLPVQIPGQIIGKTGTAFYKDTGYRSINVVLAAGHDTASAAYAAHAACKASAAHRDNEDSLVLSSGTWSMVAANVEKPITIFKDMGLMFSNALGANGKNILMRGITGLWMLQQCMSQWKKSGIKMSYSELEHFALEHLCDSWFAVDDPRLSQTQDMCHTISELCIQNGFRPPCSPYEYYLVIINSLARKYQQVFLEYEQVTKKTYDSIIIVGGGAKNKALTRLTSLYSNKKVITGPFEATSIGNIVLQLIALGEITESQVPELISTIQE